MKIQVDTINKRIYFESDSDVTTRVMAVTLNTLGRRILPTIRHNINDYKVTIQEPTFEPGSKEYNVELTIKEISRFKITDVLMTSKIKSLIDDCREKQIPQIINVNYIVI